jgi:CheY-like chemotaxis protein
LHIINDILDISKIESGIIEMENTPFDIYEIFLRCRSIILPDIKSKGLDLLVHAEPLNGKKLVGDQVRLYQAFMNLLSNAVKFTKNGKVEFSALVKSQDEDKATLFFEVKDSGIGMSSAQIKKVFDPFIQADSSTTRNYGGTGLGLTITKSIVELMGGILKVESTPGVGSTFSFEVIFDTVDTPEGMYDTGTLEKLEKPRFEGLILICDDNPLNAELICEHLSRVGLKTIVAENGRIGVDLVKERKQKGEKPFDMVFMDIFMPVMDGTEAAIEINIVEPDVPIVAMTANIMVNDLMTYRKYGMPDYLGKPFSSQNLWRVLLRHLTPIEDEAAGDGELTTEGELDQENFELQEMLKKGFVKNNSNRYAEIVEALENDDIKLAHRIMHTVKGNAAMIGMERLRVISTELEVLLKDEKLPIPDEKLSHFKEELDRVLTELETEYC